MSLVRPIYHSVTRLHHGAHFGDFGDRNGAHFGDFGDFGDCNGAHFGHLNTQLHSNIVRTHNLTVIFINL